ncbi:MAG: sucrose phosphorylase [Christensenellales bacterium]
MCALPDQVMLITYPDSLGGDLRGLKEVLAGPLKGAVGSLHILPFFPSSGDRGFSPITYDRVDPAFGGWEDIEALAADHPLMCDFMVNHISSASQEFQDYLRRGEASPHAGLFLDYDAFFGGEPDKEELAGLYRRNDNPLFLRLTLPDGGVKRLWRTFGEDQIDLDTRAPAARRYLLDNLRQLCRHGIQAVRLDAYGYISKVRGTSCFFVQPQVWGLIDDLKQALGGLPMTLLPEVHDRYETALAIAGRGYHAYDFVLPLLMLHSICTASGREMKHWFSICPRAQFTVLDTHDGIGVYDAQGILTPEQADAVIEKIEPNLSYAYKPLDPARKRNRRSYQLYCTYYSALGEDDQAYLMARALQFFAPGIPQVYYVGLLAGRNDLAFVRQEDHRAINRRNYSLEEIRQEIRRPVVSRLLALIRLRGSHPAFQGELQILDSPDHLVHLVRQSGGERVELMADLKQRDFSLLYSQDGHMLRF